MAVTVGEARIKLSFDLDESAAKKQGERSGKEVGASFSTSFKDVVKMTFSAEAAHKLFDGFVNASKAMVSTVVDGAKAIASGVKDVIAQSVPAAGEYEQLAGGVTKIFGENADTIKEFASNAYQTAGMSANEYMSTVTSFSASLLQSLKGDTAETAKVSDMAVKDMADNANMMGTSMEAIQFAYQGFSKQNYTMLDNLKLGYGGTKQEMERLLADATKLSGVKYDISNLSDVYNAIHVVQQEMGITGTTANEAAQTFEGSLNSMKGAWTNLMTIMSSTNPEKDLAQVGMLAQQVGQSVGTFLTNLEPMVQSALDGIIVAATQLAPALVENVGRLADEIGDAVVQFVPQLVKIVKDIAPHLVSAVVKLIETIVPVLADTIGEMLPVIIDGALKIIDALVKTLPTVLPKIIPPVIQGILMVVKALVDMAPTLLKAVVDTVILIAQTLTQPETLQMIFDAALQLFFALVDAIPDLIIALIDALPAIIDNIIAFLTNPDNIRRLIEAAVKLFFALVEAVPRILGALLDAFGKLVGSMWNGIIDLFKGFAGNFGNAIGDIFKGAINGVIGFIEMFIQGPVRAINFFVDIINGVIGVLGGHIDKLDLPKLPRLARGGVVEATHGGQIIMAGEAGEDEWVVPERKMSSLFRQIDEEMKARDGENSRVVNVYMNNQIDSKLDIREVCNQLTETIRRAA